MSGGREKKALLSDAVEALIAALYLDAGLESARNFIESCIMGAFETHEDGVPATVTDYKSALQETAQSLKLPPPRYVIIAEDGPEHSKTFTVEVRLGQGLDQPGAGVVQEERWSKSRAAILQQLTEWGR